MKVSILRCESYNDEVLYAALEAVLSPLGGMGAFVTPGQRVFIKPNMVEKALPERGSVTHPALVGAVVRQVVRAGGVALVGDCPGGVHTPRDVLEMYRYIGYTQAVEAAGGRMVATTGNIPRQISDTHSLSSFDMAREMLDCDVFINMAKLKTHALTGFTGAVKNLYGTIHGLTKISYHGRFAAREDFAAFLLDIATTVKPSLHIMDAILAHEGTGPTGGTPRLVNLLAASRDAHALDYACVAVMGFNPGEMPTLRLAQQYDLFDPNANEYPLEVPKSFVGRPFKRAIPKSFVAKYLVRIFPSAWRERFRPKPLVKEEMCIGCGLCIATCPAAAIHVEQKAHIDMDKCQRCFCCQELCPRKAVVVAKW